MTHLSLFGKAGLVIRALRSISFGQSTITKKQRAEQKIERQPRFVFSHQSFSQVGAWKSCAHAHTLRWIMRFHNENRGLARMALKEPTNVVNILYQVRSMRNLALNKIRYQLQDW